MNYRDFVFNHKLLINALLKIHNMLYLKNRLFVRGNKIDICCVLIKGLKVKIHGKNNVIEIGDWSRIINSSIEIWGNNNTIKIGSRCYINHTELYIEDDNNSIDIGGHTSMDGPTHLAAIETTEIKIGEDCMFSGDVSIRTGDSHVILDMDENRINTSKSVKIGKHVWIGRGVRILKGFNISDNSIIGAGSICTDSASRSLFEPNVIIAGVPARILRKGINWKRQRN